MVLSWLEDLGWRVVLERRVRDALGELNTGLPVDAYRKLTWPEGATVEARNREFHWMLVNGLPLGVIELKNAADEEATIWTAWQQLQTYKAELPGLFSMNEALVVSDGN